MSKDYPLRIYVKPDGPKKDWNGLGYMDYLVGNAWDGREMGERYYIPRECGTGYWVLHKDDVIILDALH